MKISSLLNSPCVDNRSYRGPTGPAHAAVPYSGQQAALPPKRPAKDAPVFMEGMKIVGVVNYPPHESYESRELAVEHERFKLFPQGEIYKKGVRHIPYNSDKKDFLDKTGREAFEVFQYTFKRPGEEKEYVVIWDYNVGLVRMTPFFKSCKFTKTVPAKALNQNPGLRDISYSITGGALVCQGYWMPYQAARAMAATFCYDIRWALTPIFGDDFPSICLPPKSTGHNKFLIDPAIVHYCTTETDRFRSEGAFYRLKVPVLSPPTNNKQISFESPSWTPRAAKQRRIRPADIESGYGTDASKGDSCTFSPYTSPQWTHVNRLPSPASPPPIVSPRSRCTAANGSLSPATSSTVDFSAMSSPARPQDLPLLQIPGFQPQDHCDEQLRAKRTHSNITLSGHGDNEARPLPVDAANQECGPSPKSAQQAIRIQHDIYAAELLLSLGIGRRDDGDGRMLLPPTKRTRRGSTM